MDASLHADAARHGRDEPNHTGLPPPPLDACGARCSQASRKGWRPSGTCAAPLPTAKEVFRPPDQKVNILETASRWNHHQTPSSDPPLTECSPLTGLLAAVWMFFTHRTAGVGKLQLLRCTSTSRRPSGASRSIETTTATAMPTTNSPPRGPHRSSFGRLGMRCLLALCAPVAAAEFLAPVTVEALTKVDFAVSAPVTVAEPLTTVIAAAPTNLNELLHWLGLAVLAVVIPCALCHMQAPAPAAAFGRQNNSRNPPPWTPERESTYPFQTWVQDVLSWSILATDMDAAQQTAAIILQLGGAARELARSMSYHDITQGGLINGTQVDPVTYLLTHFGPPVCPVGRGSTPACHG